MEQQTKEVFYNEYCDRCVHKDEKNKQGGENDICEECLTQPYNYDSHKPIKFREA